MSKMVKILVAAAVVFAAVVPTSSFLAPPSLAASACLGAARSRTDCVEIIRNKHTLAPNSRAATVRPPARSRSLLLGLRCTGTEPEAMEVKGADGHPIRVWRKGPANGKPIILLHGRTWSARPVWDLQVGSPARDGASQSGASIMDLLAARGYQSWAPDMRGLGGIYIHIYIYIYIYIHIYTCIYI